jgi:hypothetical protein
VGSPSGDAAAIGASDAGVERSPKAARWHGKIGSIRRVGEVRSCHWKGGSLGAIDAQCDDASRLKTKWFRHDHRLLNCAKEDCRWVRDPASLRLILSRAPVWLWCWRMEWTASSLDAIHESSYRSPVVTLQRFSLRASRRHLALCALALPARMLE